jgi:hypothetical protein
MEIARMEPLPKRTRFNPIPSCHEFGEDAWSSDNESSAAQNYCPDSDESITADEFYEARPGLLESATSNQSSEADEDCLLEDEGAYSWWAVGPGGSLSFLMQIDFDLLDQLKFYCLSSGESLPNNRGWVLDDGTLLELARDLELGIVGN